MNEPPILATDLSNDSLCDTGARACNFISAFGENIYASNNTKCRVETAQIINNTLVSTGSYVLTEAQIENMAEVRCSMTSGARRKKRSTTSSTRTNFYLVSVTNNGVNFSDSVPVIAYDSSCNTCTTTDTYVFCELRSDICVINGACYPETSSECSPASTPTSSSDSFKLWVVGAVISAMLFLIILILLIKWCGKTSPITPLDEVHAGSSHVDYREVDERQPNKKIPRRVSRINVQPVEWWMLKWKHGRATFLCLLTVTREMPFLWYMTVMAEIPSCLWYMTVMAELLSFYAIWLPWQKYRLMLYDCHGRNNVLFKLCDCHGINAFFLWYMTVCFLFFFALCLIFSTVNVY